MRYEIKYDGKEYRLFTSTCKNCGTLRGVSVSSGGICIPCISKHTIQITRFKNKVPIIFFNMTNNKLIDIIENNKYVGIRRWREAERFKGVWPSIEV